VAVGQELDCTFHPHSFAPHPSIRIRREDKIFFVEKERALETRFSRRREVEELRKKKKRRRAIGRGKKWPRRRRASM
jgi:hypothetical protein